MLGWEDPLEKGMSTHSTILAWRIPWRIPGRLQSMGSEVRGGGQEELPRVRSQGPRPGGDDLPPSPKPGAAGRRSYPTPPHPRRGAAAGRSNPSPKARGGGQEGQLHVQGAMAALAQEGLEELSHVESQEGQR